MFSYLLASDNHDQRPSVFVLFIDLSTSCEHDRNVEGISLLDSGINWLDFVLSKGEVTVSHKNVFGHNPRIHTLIITLKQLPYQFTLNT